jgi:TrpR family trp operon transcriptional repressor
MLLPESLKLLTDTLWQIQDRDELEKVLEDLMSPWELVEIAERINIIRSLKEGKTQRVIADDLGISVTTVSRGSRVLKYWRGVIEKYV